MFNINNNNNNENGFDNLKNTLGDLRNTASKKTQELYNIASNSGMAVYGVLANSTQRIVWGILFFFILFVFLL